MDFNDHSVKMCKNELHISVDNFRFSQEFMNFEIYTRKIIGLNFFEQYTIKISEVAKWINNNKVK